MNLHINLLRESQQLSKRYRFIVAILILFFIAYQIYYLKLTYPDIALWIITIFWILLAVASLYHILAGKRFIELFGKAYLNIDQKGIALKPSLFVKEQSLLWKDIKDIRMHSSFIELISSDFQKIRIDYNRLTYKEVQKIKKFLSTYNPEQYK